MSYKVQRGQHKGQTLDKVTTSYIRGYLLAGQIIKPGKIDKRNKQIKEFTREYEERKTKCPSQA